MRVVLVGSPTHRERLRQALAGASIEIAGEALTLSDARALAKRGDAFLVAPTEETRDPIEEPLTAREREVLAALAEGLSNKHIAHRLGISDQTVKFHVASICGKLGALNRTEAVRLAIQHGLVAI